MPRSAMRHPTPMRAITANIADAMPPPDLRAQRQRRGAGSVIWRAVPAAYACCATLSARSSFARDVAAAAMSRSVIVLPERDSARCVCCFMLLLRSHCHARFAQVEAAAAEPAFRDSQYASFRQPPPYTLIQFIFTLCGDIFSMLEGHSFYSSLSAGELLHDTPAAYHAEVALSLNNISGFCALMPGSHSRRSQVIK